jgi:hypothetical protein
MRQVHIGNTLAIPESKRFKLARRENSRELLVVEGRQPFSYVSIGESGIAERAPVT